MKFKFKLNVNAAVDELEIESTSIEDAYSILSSMSLSDFEHFGLVGETNLEGITYESTRNYVVDVYDIKYSIEGDADLHDDCGNNIRQITESLERSMTLEFECNAKDFDVALVNALSDRTGFLIDDFKYDIVSEN